MKEISLTNGFVAVVDDEDYERLNRHSWHIQYMQRGTKIAAARTGTTGAGERRGQCIYMHREVLSAPANLQVDHIDGNLLNNQKSNLRLATNAQNQANQPIPLGKFKGIKKRNSGRWGARIKAFGKEINLGTYDTPVEAAMIYDAAAVYCYREFAVLNFPEHKDDYLLQSDELDNTEDE